MELPELDLGGGLGIAYLDSDDPQPLDQLAARLLDIVAGECGRAGLALPRVAVEPGRAIVGPAMLTLYEVGTVKSVDGIRTYVSVDGGMSDNIRTALYDADYTVTLANRASSEPLDAHPGRRQALRVRRHRRPRRLAAGRHAVRATCSPWRRPAPTAGPWPATTTCVGRPPVVAVGDGAARVIVRRETMDDLLACDVG